MTIIDISSNDASVIDEAMAIIKERAEKEGKQYDERLTVWCLEGLLFREGKEAALEFARTAPFQCKRPKAFRGYA